MKFNLNDFLQLDVKGLLAVNGGGGNKKPIETAGSCSNINLGKYVDKGADSIF